MTTDNKEFKKPEDTLQIHVAKMDECQVPSHIVWFRVAHPASGKIVVLDSRVPLSETKDMKQEDIARKAYDLVKDAIQKFKEECEMEDVSVVGRTIDPGTGTLQ